MWWNRRYEKGFCPEDTNIFEEKLEVLKKFEDRIIDSTVSRCLDIIQKEENKHAGGSSLKKYLQFAENILSEQLSLLRDGLNEVESKI